MTPMTDEQTGSNHINILFDDDWWVMTSRSKIVTDQINNLSIICSPISHFLISNINIVPVSIHMIQAWLSVGYIIWFCCSAVMFRKFEIYDVEIILNIFLYTFHGEKN